MKNNKGFTLVELLLVIVIISTLTGVVLSVVNVNGMRARSRDSQRKSDIAKIQAALELYYTDNRSYPISTSGNWINLGAAGNPLSSALVPSYIDVLPNDPSYSTAATDPCSRDFNGDATNDYRYNYRTPSTGAGFYILTALMENSVSDDDSKCSSISNWSNATCGSGSTVCGCTSGNSYNGTPDYCYGVQNPF